jgi:hypothetical protein
MWFVGTLPAEFALYPDYDSYGPTYTYPRDTCWIAVTPPWWDLYRTDIAAYNLVQVYTDPDPPFETWGGLPFGDLYQTQNVEFHAIFLPQDAYLAEHLHNINSPHNDVTLNFYGRDFLSDGIPLVGEFDLRGGDANGSNWVNLTDLGAVLSEFNQTGYPFPPPE